MVGQIFRKIFRKSSYEPLNKITLSKDNLLSNLQYLKSINKSVKIAPVLKSNAYGHGIKQVAQVLDHLSCPFFCVDSLFEAYELYKLNVKTPVLIMGYVDPDNLRIKKLPFSYAVWSLEQARKIGKIQKGAKVHIFVDTGMNREGVPMGELEQFVKNLHNIEGVIAEGLMSHFASSGTSDPRPKKQLKNFQKAVEIVEKSGLHPKWRHIAASGGLVNGYIEGTNLARVGRALYGIEPNDKKNFNGGLALYSKIIQIKRVTKGSKIGYDGTFTANKDMDIGILPIGYNDGVDRRLSNKGFIVCGGIKCPIIGRISMNVTTIDLSGVNNPYVGQDVIVYSEKREDSNSIEATAQICNTLPHDILVHLSPSTKRTII